MLSGPHAYAASCLRGLPKCASENCSQKCIFLATPARHQQRRSVRDQSRIAPTQRPTIGLWSRLTGLRRNREAESCRLRHTLESLAWVLDEPSGFSVSGRSLSAPKKRRAVSRPPAAPAHAGPTPLQGRPRSLTHTPRPPPACTFAIPTWITRKSNFLSHVCAARMRRPGGLGSRRMGTKLWAPRSLQCEAPSGRLGRRDGGSR